MDFPNEKWWSSIAMLNYQRVALGAAAVVLEHWADRCWSQRWATIVMGWWGYGGFRNMGHPQIIHDNRVFPSYIIHFGASPTLGNLYIIFDIWDLLKLSWIGAENGRLIQSGWWSMHQPDWLKDCTHIYQPACFSSGVPMTWACLPAVHVAGELAFCV